MLFDPLLRRRVSELHHALGEAGGELDAESRLAFVTERLRRHLGAADGFFPERGPTADARRGADVAGQLRDLIDAGFREQVTLRQAAETIHAHPAHLVRMFSREFGISPHQYLAGRRVDLARRLLLDGMPASEAAATAGFYDQSHLTRSFRRTVGTSPGRYAGRGAPLA